jgi:hypothetical protein
VVFGLTTAIGAYTCINKATLPSLGDGEPVCSFFLIPSFMWPQTVISPRLDKAWACFPSAVEHVSFIFKPARILGLRKRRRNRPRTEEEEEEQAQRKRRNSDVHENQVHWLCFCRCFRSHFNSLFLQVVFDNWCLVMVTALIKGLISCIKKLLHLLLPHIAMVSKSKKNTDPLK